MKFRIFPIVLGFVFLVFSSCGKESEETVPTAQELRNSMVSEDEYSVASDEALDGFASPDAALWSNLRSTDAWTTAVLKVVRNKFSSFEAAKDVETFCPGYRKASQFQKENCWLRLVSAVVRFESSFKPGDSFREPNGAYSVGLLALSPGECPNAPDIKSLKNPVKNLECGVGKMAKLIASGRYIDGPKGNRGAAAYWSVLRAPYRYKKYKLGKKHLIVPLTKEYRKFQ